MQPPFFNMQPSSFIADILGVRLDVGIAALLDRKLRLISAVQPQVTVPVRNSVVADQEETSSLQGKIIELARKGKTAVEIGTELRASGHHVSDTKIVYACRHANVQLKKSNKGPVTVAMFDKWREAKAQGVSEQEIADHWGYSARTVTDYITGRRIVNGNNEN